MKRDAVSDFVNLRFQVFRDEDKIYSFIYSNRKRRERENLI